jgi:quinol monooxygenase YgiN
MIIVLGEVVADAKAIESARGALVKMQQETRKEAGCVSYGFSIDVGDAAKIVIAERWMSMAELEAHMKTPHMAEFGKAVGAIKPTAMDIKAYEIAGEVKLPL